MAKKYETMAAIKAMYPNQWILIDKPKVDRHEQILGAYVLYHGEDKMAVYERAMQVPAPINLLCSTSAICPKT